MRTTAYLKAIMEAYRKHLQEVLGRGDFYIDVGLDQLFCAQFRVSINIYIYNSILGVGGGGGGGRQMDIFFSWGRGGGILWIFGGEGGHKI